ncbi:MAG TPA: uracil-DNA glycosylase family protein [Candidatus Acidoferrales bacterium]|nr:uracil-DNA glycosylase family protein [Candidatus Acidoferrales bacterium]
MSPRRSIREQLSQLQRDCRACTRCVEDGILPAANPTFEGSWDARLMLVGQAPGRHEIETRRPFSGRAGKELDRWMLRAGFESAADFRRRTYIAAMVRCFPGRHPDGGDRRPPAGAVANCASWLEAELELLRPQVVIAVGQLAIERFLGPGRLEDRVGRSFGRQPVIVPLPHPSGQSRWLNQAANRERLAQALVLISDLCQHG